MAAKLRQHFTVITVDLLGLGGSGRPTYKMSSPELATTWFLHAFRKWVVKSDFKDPFHLLGHSLGGYVAGNYA